MEAEWQADRSALRDLLHTRPDLSLKEISRRLKRSYSWVKDWAKRLAAAPPDDLEVLCSRSRARHTQPPDWDPLVLQRIEQMRLFPPEGLQRTPGPKALLYYLPRDAELQEKGCRLPRSTTTIWYLLKHLGLLADTPVSSHKEEPLCEPLEEVQTDWRRPWRACRSEWGGQKAACARASSTLSMREPRFCWQPGFREISVLVPRWPRSSTSYWSTGVHNASPLTTIRVG